MTCYYGPAIDATPAVHASRAIVLYQDDPRTPMSTPTRPDPMQAPADHEKVMAYMAEQHRRGLSCGYEEAQAAVRSRPAPRVSPVLYAAVRHEASGDMSTAGPLHAEVMTYMLSKPGLSYEDAKAAVYARYCS